ncbi:MAG: PTS galactitol transporter subunit IIB [Erysipelotrichia bacterium]|nr:PTS galactitol transporter subunit IIB [Erysipelotrichia bacterium]
MKKVRILVACGGGIATSSFAAMVINEIAKEANVQVEIHKERIVDALLVADEYDMLCVTSRLNQTLKTRIIQVGGLISGINEEKVRETIKQNLIELANE